VCMLLCEIASGRASVCMLLLLIAVETRRPCWRSCLHVDGGKSPGRGRGHDEGHGAAALLAVIVYPESRRNGVETVGCWGCFCKKIDYNGIGWGV
jgi:hypothetical protein